MQAGQLGPLVRLLKLDILGVRDDACPDLLQEGRVGVRRDSEFGPDPLLRYPSVVLCLLVDVSGPIQEIVVCGFDAEHTSVGPVELSSASFV
jgi:hypothetical protein